MAPLALSCSLFLGLQILAAGSVGAKPVGPDGAAPSEPVVGARALLLPDGEGHGLALQNSTLAWLRTLPGPLAVVTAIGQYRSGKSFLLNQLMGIPCDRGFGVGHKRETQTKGVWAFASTDNVTGATRIYLDTEGFDATGKAQVYDDRIFAFSALASSALLYNLVETIKEADIEKLAFPHVRRTELCDLPTSELSPDYLVGLQRVRAWVSAHSAGRGGRLWRSGAELATQVGQLVNVLNAQRIPTAGSVIDAFNRELVQRVLGELRRALAAVGLPLDAAELTAAYQSALAAAQHRLRTDAFGSIGSGSGSATDDFQQGTKVALQTMENENFRASHELCKSLWGHCAASLERLKLNTLPSRRRFRARISECNATLAACVGPAAEETHERLGLAATAGAREYGDAFLQRITHLLILACVSGILLFRYILKNGLGEMLCWLMLLSAEVLPRLNAVANFNPFGGGAAASPTAVSFWDTPTGINMLQAYEAIVYNEYADLDDWLQIGLVLVGAALLWRVLCRCCGGCCCGGRDADADGHSSRGRRRGGRSSRRRRYATPSEDEEDEEDDYEDDGWNETPSSNRPLRGGGRYGRRMLDL